MWLEALLLSLIVLPFGTGVVLENARHLGRDNGSFAIFFRFLSRLGDSGEAER